MMKPARSAPTRWSAGPRAALVALLASSGAAPTARAADKGDEDTTPISALIGDAIAEYDAGRFQEARALFRKAHERAPTARTLRGIGMASFELRDYVEATRALGASLRDERRPLTNEQKRHAESLLARAHTFVGRFTVHVKPPNASLFVDGRPAEPEPDGILLLGFGPHHLSLRCALCTPNEKDHEIEVAGGERRDIELVLAPTPPSPDTPAITVVGMPPGGAGDASAERGHAHLWLAGLAGAAALGAGASGLWWREEQHELGICKTAIAAGDICTAQAAIEDRRQLAIGLTIGLGVAAVASAVFAAILWSPPVGHDSNNVACVIGKGTLSCAARF